MNRISKLLFVFFSAAAFGQSVSGKLEPVTADGLHRILIDADLRYRSQPDLADFRILDESGKEIPYAFSHGKGIASPFFHAFKQISRASKPGKYSAFIYETAGKATNCVTLRLAGSAIEKYFSISGSDDLDEWYGLAQDIRLYSSNAENVSEYALPKNNYRYLKIVFDDKKTLPVNLLGAGYMETTGRAFDPAVRLNPKSVTITEIKNSKKTCIEIRFDRKVWVDSLSFDIPTKGFYDRDVRIYSERVDKTHPGKRRERKPLRDFNLSSMRSKKVEAQFYEKVVFIEIDNLDSPPLDIRSVDLLQSPARVIAFLEKGKQYRVVSGDPTRTKPEYDLSRFDVTKLQPMPEIRMTDITHGSRADAVSSAPTAFWQAKWFMWSCIGIGVLVVSFFAVGMVRDMKKEG